MMSGSYELTYHAFKESVWNDLTNYRHDADASTEAKILRKETDGSYTTVTTGLSDFYKTSVTSKFDDIVTEPGEYYILFPLQGIMSYVTTQNELVSTGSYHTSSVLKGPLIISEDNTGSRVSTLILAWDQPNQYYSDNLPDYMKLVASNAIDLFPADDIQSSRKTDGTADKVLRH